MIWRDPDTLHRTRRTRWTAAAREKATVPLTPSYSLISLILDSAINANMREPQSLHLTELARSNRWLFARKTRQQKLKARLDTANPFSPLRGRACEAGQLWFLDVSN